MPPPVLGRAALANVSVFSFGCLTWVVSSWVASLECFKEIRRENILDGVETCLHKSRDFSLWHGCFAKSEYFSNIDIGEVLPLFSCGWNILHRGAIEE